jgi:hypothetical protein
VREQAEWIRQMLPGVKFSVDCFFIRKAPWDPILVVRYARCPVRPTKHRLVAIGRRLRVLFALPRCPEQQVAVAIWR